METGDVVRLKIPAMKEKVTVMDPGMEVNMMVIEDANLALFVEATIVENLDFITMKKMTAAKNHQQKNLSAHHKNLQKGCGLSPPKGRSAAEEITKVEDVVLLRTLVI